MVSSAEQAFVQPPPELPHTLTAAVFGQVFRKALTPVG